MNIDQEKDIHDVKRHNSGSDDDGVVIISASLLYSLFLPQSQRAHDS